MKEVNIELWKMISTHALTEGDGLDVVEEYNFEISTHALTEGDAVENYIVWQRSFQLTPSRRATSLTKSVSGVNNISTHALTEGDPQVIQGIVDFGDFNSRPHGGRHSPV